MQDTAASLRQRNRTLAAEMSRHKRTIADLEGRLNAAHRRQRNFDATVSAVHRVWYQLEDDLRSAATALGPFQKAPAEPPPPDPDGGGGGSPALLLSNLLRAPAVPLADAAAAAVTWCAKAEVACSRGRSAAVAADGTLDLASDSDSDLEDGEVVSAPAGSSSSVAAAAAAAGGSSSSAQVDTSLRQRARFSTDLMAHVFTALTHASKAPADAKAAGLQALRAELEGQKRAAAAATATLCDQLTEALQRRRDVARELRAARRDRHRALRRLEQLAAAGVAVPDGAAKGGDAALGGNGSSAAAAAAVAAVATGLPPKWPNGHPPPSAAAAAAGMGALPPGSAGVSAINGSAVPLSISAVAALDIADAEGALPREDADRLKSELAAIAAAAAARLVEADAIRADKVALEKEVTRLAARAMSLLGEGPVDDETASVASGDGAPAPPPLAMAMAVSKVPPNHPDLVRLQELLKAERSLLETECARAAAADTLAINARVARETLDAALNHERQTMDAHWTAQVEGSTGAMSGAVEGLAEATAHLKHAEGDIQHVRALHVELDDVHQRLHNAQAAAHQLRHALQQAAYQAAKLESDAERARSSPPGGAGAGNAASLQARLAEATEELSQSRTVVDAVMADVEITAAALEAALAQSQALSEHVAAAEAARDDCLARLRDSRMQCEALTAQKSALELRSRDAESAAVELEAAASAHVAAHESNAAEVEAARDAAQRASESEHDAHERAAASVMQATAELRLARRRLAALKSRCDDLQARETAAQAGEKRAQEQAATAQRRAERAKASLTRLQQYLAGGGGEGGFAGGGAGEESALLAEEVQELRKALRCSVCSARQKNCVLTKCYHMFCRECVDENLRTRHRKCPACGKGFGADDVKAIYLT
ncbi:hypothetical protein JKP88DRAFT_334791 [Tribonema minus]|uniref:E3 ubiquitin protein ligase n=1 Tax=Tribonema minus TaxID=303371 RepID=A0A835YTC8_9STRA|nr:hypothetical protein JKP88DRAFT_334791 [Tribonema minus]